jgi:hypothetical protein
MATASGFWLMGCVLAVALHAWATHAGRDPWMAKFLWCVLIAIAVVFVACSALMVITYRSAPFYNGG